MAKHVVIVGPVDHDGVRYFNGDELQLPSEAAAALLALKVVEVMHSKSKPIEPRD